MHIKHFLLDRNTTRKLNSDIQSIKLFRNNVDIRNISRNDAVIFRFKNKVRYCWWFGDNGGDDIDDCGQIY